MEVSPSVADRTNVTGTASLSGTIHIVPEAGTYTIGSRYTVLNATGGVSGTVGTTEFANSFGPAFRPRIEYDATNVYLVLAPGSISPFLVNGSRNQPQSLGRLIKACSPATRPRRSLRCSASRRAAPRRARSALRRSSRVDRGRARGREPLHARRGARPVAAGVIRRQRQHGVVVGRRPAGVRGRRGAE